MKESKKEEMKLKRIWLPILQVKKHIDIDLIKLFNSDVKTFINKFPNWDK